MIADVAKGIKTKFSGSTLSTLVGGRLYRDSAKQNETMPYVVFTCISDNQADTYNEDLEYHHWMFYIWCNLETTGYSGLDALESALRALFDNSVLTISGWTNLIMRWAGTTPVISEDDNVIGIMIGYEGYIQKT